MKVDIEFSGGLDLLFGGAKNTTVEVPVEDGTPVGSQLPVADQDLRSIALFIKMSMLFMLLLSLRALRILQQRVERVHPCIPLLFALTPPAATPDPLSSQPMFLIPLFVAADAAAVDTVDARHHAS